MKAVLTKWMGPTTHRGSRIKAYAEGGNKLVVPYNYSLEADENHYQAAVALCKKLDWPLELIQGATPDGYCHVFKPNNNERK